MATEILCACQGIDLRGNKGLGAGTKIVYREVRKLIPMLKKDRPLYEDINKCEELIINGTITKIL